MICYLANFTDQSRRISTLLGRQRRRIRRRFLVHGLGWVVGVLSALAVVYYLTVASADNWAGAVCNLGRYFMPVAPLAVALVALALVGQLLALLLSLCALAHALKIGPGGDLQLAELAGQTWNQ